MTAATTPYPAVPLAAQAPCICLRRALATVRPIPPDHRGEPEISNQQLLQRLNLWRRETGIPRRKIVKALEIGAQRVFMSELFNWTQERREEYLQRNRRFPPEPAGPDDTVAWWGEFTRLVGRETATARNLVQAFPGQVEERVQEAMAARRETLSHPEGRTERLAGDAFWRLLKVVRGIGFEWEWYELSHKEWERRMRALGFIPMQRRRDTERASYRIVPGFRHKLWTSSVQRLHTVVMGHCANPLATTYDVLTLFFPDWWPTECYQRLRDRRREAMRLRTKLKTNVS